MTIFELQLYIEEIEKNPLLCRDREFDKRMEAIDFIDFQVMGRIEELLSGTDQPDQLILLRNRAEKVKTALEEIDVNLFQQLQQTIKAAGYTRNGFRNLVNEYLDITSYSNEYPEEIGYDNLDIFINGLSPLQTMPEQTRDLEPEMVYYQKTPARIVFELAEKVHFIKEDIFFDIGAGLGQVAILVHLLTGIPARGIEFEPAFCDYAGDCAAALHLRDVTFINVDARKADYSEGTVFFMFTPFKGEILQEVLAILQKESQWRKIKIITYGPCTARVALESWLHFATQEDNNMYKLAVFNSY
jgi:predicted RNA methylase